MSCLALDEGQLDAALDLLKSNEVVALPTETVYGLAGRLGSERALAKIFSLKARPRLDPLIVHVFDAAMLRPFVVEEPGGLARRLMDAFWPGPLTLLFRKNAKRVPDLCTSGSEWVAARSPAHPVFRRALERLGEPLAAPSANRFGRISPTSAGDCVRELGPYGLEAVVDGGLCTHGVESTIVRVIDESFVEVLRPGALSIESIQEAAGSSVEIGVRRKGTERPEAPGLLKSHYAPSIEVRFWEERASQPPRDQAGSETALLWVSGPVPSEWSSLPWGRIVALAESGDDRQSAARLFRALRELDESGVKRILAVRGPDAGLGLAVNDRLRRAAGRGGEE